MRLTSLVMSKEPNSGGTVQGSRSHPSEPIRREDFSSTADAIAADFRKLVELLGRTADMLKGTDEEFAQQLCATKAVAERGLRLGTVLSRMTRRK